MLSCDVAKLWAASAELRGLRPKCRDHGFEARTPQSTALWVVSSTLPLRLQLKASEAAGSGCIVLKSRVTVQSITGTPRHESRCPSLKQTPLPTAVPHYCRRNTFVESTKAHPTRLCHISTTALSPVLLTFILEHRYISLHIPKTKTHTSTMPQIRTHIFRTYPRWHLLSTALLLYGNFELYRILSETHPTITPRLQRSGINPRNVLIPTISIEVKKEEPASSARGRGQETAGRNAAESGVGVEWDKLSGREMEKGSAEEMVRERERRRREREEWDAEPGWQYIGGVPVPTFDLLMRPFRRN